ncbi:hypothetical protein GQ457_08G023990 [Hibiscus cannabinus]
MKASWPWEQHTSESRSSDGRIYRSKEKTSNHQIHFRDDRRVISHFRSDNVKGDNEEHVGVFACRIWSPERRLTAADGGEKATDLNKNKTKSWGGKNSVTQCLQVARVGDFGLAEGVDRSGVTTKILTCNCSYKTNQSSSVSISTLHRWTYCLSLSHTYVRNQVNKIALCVFLYNSHVFCFWHRRDRSYTLKVLRGNARRSMQDLLESGMGLPLLIRLRLRSDFRVVWNLIKPKFHHQAQCLLLLDKKHHTQKYNSTCTITS